MLRLGLIGLIPLVLCACGGSPPPSSPPPRQVPRPPPERVEPPRVVAPPPAPTLRLDGVVKPTSYAARLVIDPAQPTFTGTISIDLEVTAEVGGVWLHGVDLTITRATLSTRNLRFDVTPIAPTPETTKAEVIGFAFPRAVEPGTAQLSITYTGRIYDKETEGIHRQLERGEWYVFTQFEATDARRAFPCFDEPGFKVPFALTLDVKPGHLAVANTPVVAERADAAGTKTVEFATTKPLPTYLLAFAVGPFEIVDGGRAGKANTPLRIVVAKGRTADAAYATRHTPELLAALEAYFGIPYPYEKLDQIAVPRKGGAMENPGLITYGEGILIWPADEDSPTRHRRFASVAAHELGHQWFGDLVTLAWWNDLWLNESFASWIGDSTVERWQPAWQLDVNRVTGRSGAMRGDTLQSSRKIRQPIESKADIENAFDGITYGKGSAVLAMVEGWLGRDRFQVGVRAYLGNHAHGVATTEQFLAALAAQAPEQPVAQVLSSFLDQTGVPLIGVELACAKDQAPQLRLTQQRYTTIGSTAPTQQTWHVPVCVRVPEGRACTVLAAATGTLALPGKTCPAWVLANDGERGYYRVDYRGDLLRKLLAVAGTQLTLAERIGVYGDLAALVDADRLPVTRLLELAFGLAAERARQLVSTATSFAGYLENEYTPRALRPNRARFLRQLFGARARALGFAAVRGEADDARLLRGALVPLVASTGEDPQLIATAKQLANRWLADRKAIDPEMVGTVLGIAARFGDRALFDKLHAAAKVEQDRRQRGQLLGAMASFREPAIVDAALAITLTDEFPAYEAIGLLWGALDEDNGERAWAFLKQHHDALIAKLPRDYSFARAAGTFCDPAHKAEAEAFFKDKVAHSARGPRGLAQTLERVELCIARKQAFAPAVAKFLARY